MKKVREWLPREDFQRFWDYTSSASAGKSLDEWAELTQKKAYEFKSYKVTEVPFVHTPGKLPTPQVTHRFW